MAMTPLLSIVIPFMLLYHATSIGAALSPKKCSGGVRYEMSDFGKTSLSVVGSGKTKVVVSLDKTTLPAPDKECILDGVLLVSYNENWNPTGSDDGASGDSVSVKTSAFGADKCTSSVTGGHWDPTGACSPLSGMEEQCKKKGTPGFADGFTDSEGYTMCASHPAEYQCTPNVFIDNSQDPCICEVGDVSGKYGTITLKEEDDAYTGSFDVADKSLTDPCWLVDKSVVFSCLRNGSTDSTPLFCGKLQEMDPSDNGEAGDPDSAKKLWHHSFFLHCFLVFLALYNSI